MAPNADIAEKDHLWMGTSKLPSDTNSCCLPLEKELKNLAASYEECSAVRQCFASTVRNSV